MLPPVKSSPASRANSHPAVYMSHPVWPTPRRYSAWLDEAFGQSLPQAGAGGSWGEGGGVTIYDAEDAADALMEAARRSGWQLDSGDLTRAQSRKWHGDVSSMKSHVACAWG